MARPRSLALGLGFLVVAGVLLWVADPTLPAELGLTTVPGTAFVGTDEAADAYRIEWSYAVTRNGYETGVSRTLVRHPNGSWFATERGRLPAAGSSSDPTPVSSQGAYRAGDERAYSRETYAHPVTRETVPGIVPEHVLVDGRVVYRREPPDAIHRWSAVLPDRLNYARVGTVTRNGERLVAYRVVGHDSAALPILASRYEGTLYATHDGVVRAYDISADGEEETVRLEYRASTTPRTPLPGWLETARSIPDPPAEEGPELRVIEGLDGTYALFRGGWRAPANASVALIDGPAGAEADVSTAGLPAGAVGEPVGEGDFRRLRLTRDGRFALEPYRPVAGDPAEVIVDHRGVNMFRTSVEPGEALFEARTYPGRLRPDAGGGRAIRLDHVELPADSSLPVTQTVGNRSTEFRIDVPEAARERDRWYLVRTTAGVELVADGRITPTSLPTMHPPASTRFPTNATITTAVAGIPVWRDRIPARLTDANERPIEASRTGVTVEAYENASNDDVHRNPFPGRSFDGYTLLYVHNWAYPDGVNVEGGVRPEQFTCAKDHNCYYRVPDGASVEVRGGGIVLVDARVDGRATYAP